MSPPATSDKSTTTVSCTCALMSKQLGIKLRPMAVCMPINLQSLTDVCAAIVTTAVKSSNMLHDFAALDYRRVGVVPRPAQSPILSTAQKRLANAARAAVDTLVSARGATASAPRPVKAEKEAAALSMTQCISGSRTGKAMCCVSNVHCSSVAHHFAHPAASCSSAPWSQSGSMAPVPIRG